MTVLIPILAGIGALCMSNPVRRKAKKRRRVSRRRNPARMGKNMKNALEFAQRHPGWQTYKSRDAATRHAIRSLAKLGLVELAHTGQFSEYRIAQGSNPGKRRKGKRKGHRTSPGAAASRLAWWRWHSNPSRNPKPRDLTEHEFTRGSAHVTIATWRNANATAFIAVTARGPGGVKGWEAKSQGPSAGGYSKPDQAAERVVKELTGKWPHDVTRETGYGLLKVIADIAAEKVGGTKSNPRRRKSRRKSRR